MEVNSLVVDVVTMMRGNDLIIISNCGMPVTFVVGFTHLLYPLSVIQISLVVIIPTFILSFIFIKKSR